MESQSCGVESRDFSVRLPLIVVLVKKVAHSGVSRARSNLPRGMFARVGAIVIRCAHAVSGAGAEIRLWCRTMPSVPGPNSS